MRSQFRTFPTPFPRGQTPGEVIREHRARLAVEEEMRATRRRLELREQPLCRNSPATRILVWEKMHGLRLSLNTAHPILRMAAAATSLTIEDLRQEQRARIGAHSRSP